MSALSAVFYRNYLLRRKNPFLMFWDVVAPIAYLLLFGIGYEQLLGGGLEIDGEHVRYTTFLVSGVLGLVTFGIAVNTSWSFFMDRDSGMAEEMLTYPLTRPQILLGKLAFNIALALASSTLVLLVGGLVTDIPVRPEMLPLILAVTILSQTTQFFVFDMVAIKINQMDAYNAVVGVLYVLLMFLSPMFYPLTDMPLWFKVVSYLNPMTWQIDLLRFALLGVGDPQQLLIEGAALVAVTVAGVAIGLRSLHHQP
ncbi:ABC transporter permease [Xanthomonas theicola]|uniref:Transport permease protein n=1 Tax=Xanthomonas theicola TaxID=56464 RepID=A0A2S6ZFU7_9XANT|nr:ABC transporter permease [Xanthomonas theicola]PPT91132.1 hypothetical protein XthCFBP4691_09095 [Xanthomonas theicola]QNH25423.1 ABC transporter permease [Xanthomonas theicola]